MVPVPTCDIPRHTSQNSGCRAMSLAPARALSERCSVMLDGPNRSTLISGNNNARRNGKSRLEWRRTVTRIARAMFLATLLLSGCSIKKFAINKLGDSLANSGTTFASDDDPEFVGQAVPFSLKLIEGLIAESPKHRGLLFAASSGFTQYSYVYVQQPAEEIEERDLEQSNVLRARARKLYLRARDYGMPGLEGKHPKISAVLRDNPETALRRTRKTDLPLLYWTALSWGAAISV